MSRHPRTAICIRKDKASFDASQLHLSDSTIYVQPQSNYFALKNRSHFFNDRSRGLCVSDRRAPSTCVFSLGSCGRRTACGRRLGRHRRPDDGAVNAPRLQWAVYPLQTLRASLRCHGLCRALLRQRKPNPSSPTLHFQSIYAIISTSKSKKARQHNTAALLLNIQYALLRRFYFLNLSLAVLYQVDC